MFKKFTLALLAITLLILTAIPPYHAQAQTARSLSQLNIVLDPAHGGIDPGGTVTVNGMRFRESDIALEISLHLRNLLRQAGINVHMTRTTDTYVSLSNRAAFANNLSADYFITIHLNYATNASANGTETYIHPASGNASRNLAQSIQNRKVNDLGKNNRGVRTANFAVLRETSMPAVLSEVGFLTSAVDRAILTSSQGQIQAAEALYFGILDYLAASNYHVPGHLFGASVPPQVTSSTGVTIDYLNLRQGAGTGFDIITTLNPNTSLNIIGQNGVWFNVRVGTQEGWVHSNFVRLTEQTPPPPVASTPSTPTPPPAGTTRAGTTTTNLNLRQGAGTGFDIITTLNPNTAVSIIGENGAWFNVLVSGQEGWVHSSFIQQQATPPSTTNNTNQAGTTTAHLNLRQGAGTNFDIITTLNPNTSLTILGQNGAWFNVRVGTQEGWVHSDFVQTGTSSQTTRTGTTIAHLNLRQGAGTNFDIITTLDPNTHLTILTESGAWFNVRIGSQEGWVHSNYVR